MAMDVRAERTGWRDSALSERHRRWGWDCPALDMDFIMLEYDNGKATAIVEYKNEHARPQYPSHPTYRALADLGNRAGLPVFACRYADDFSWWRAVPLNDAAGALLPSVSVLTEEQWVGLMYRTRGMEAPKEVLSAIADGVSW